MTRQRPHQHHCADCGTPTECPGEWEQNHDALTEVFCAEFERAPEDFVCDACHEKRERAAADADAEVTA